MTHHQFIRAVFLGALLVTAGSAWAAGFKIVVHPSNPLSSMTKNEVSEYLLKRKLEWPDGKPVIPVDQQESSPVRAAVLHDLFGRSATAIRNYWQQQIFSGRAVPPVEKASDEEVMTFIQSSPGAIGYVSESAHVGKLIVVVIR
jgi:ABC-type phosphate transport system substrate-binding protein